MRGMKLDHASSTVTLADRRFPAVVCICPPEDYLDRDDEDRSLGTSGTYSTEAVIPAENGVLFHVETMGQGRDGLALAMWARTCYRTEPTPVDGWIWLPHSLNLHDGEFTRCPVGTFDWRNAEPEWVVETIDRLSRKPYTEPEGPAMRLVRLDHFDRLAA